VIQTDPEQLQSFAEFSRLKLAVGGPDVHMHEACKMLEQSPWLRERAAWWLCTYLTFCSVPPALLMIANWPDPRNVVDQPEQVLDWIRAHWAGLPIRTQRRPVRSPPKLAKSLSDFAAWSLTDAPRLGQMTYEEAWTSLAVGVKYCGRYVLIKTLEAFRRVTGHEHLVPPDIRPAGAWSPRRALGMLVPAVESTVGAKHDNTRSTIALTNLVAEAVRGELAVELDRAVSYYLLEVLLCNWRQTQHGTLYVGRTIDSELAYYHKVARYVAGQGGTMPLEAEFFRARREAFPAECLGEVQGWDDVRLPLKHLFAEHGYFWSDLRFDWNRTDDLARPARR
jgi:hypothetical protein